MFMALEEASLVSRVAMGHYAEMKMTTARIALSYLNRMQFHPIGQMTEDTSLAVENHFKFSALKKLVGQQLTPFRFGPDKTKNFG